MIFRRLMSRLSLSQKCLVPIGDYLTDDGEIVALIKPQFEAGREKVGKKGVVREKSTHREVIEKVDRIMRIVNRIIVPEYRHSLRSRDQKEISNTLIHLKKMSGKIRKQQIETKELDQVKWHEAFACSGRSKTGDGMESFLYHNKSIKRQRLF